MKFGVTTLLFNALRRDAWLILLCSINRRNIRCFRPKLKKLAYVARRHVPLSGFVSCVVVHTVRVVVAIHSVAAGTVLYECITPANIPGLRARSITNNSNPYGKGCIITNA